ncbi:MAG: DUF72 domain-containing protein [Thermonemataceae bacterium]|nr:DUF72 domain-containing protein [Thermonemataceae bacterium]
MDFGKLNDISTLSFKLPKESPENQRVLRENEPANTQILVGLPIWANKNWLGKIYPKNTPSSDFLKIYAQQFNTIELNATHYSLPEKKTIEKWCQDIDKDFRFCPKVPQQISHTQKLQGTTKLVDEFVERMSFFSHNLGLSFLQLSPFFEYKNMDVVEDFLSKFPSEIPLALEFRHQSWFEEGNFEQMAKILEKYKTATVITDVAGRRDVLHQRVTSDKQLIRFVGNNLHHTDYTRIDDWVEQIKKWLNEGLKEIYFFIHQPDNLLAPELASYLIEKLNLIDGLYLKTPKFVQSDVQMKLF